MEAESENRSRTPSSSSKRGRKPLSDTTNNNFVVPTSSAFRNLSSSLSSPPRFPKPKPKPNSNENSKPYSSSKTSKPTTNSSKSDTSIGSSNFNHDTPPIAKTPRRISVANPGNGSEGLFEPVIVYSRRGNADKTKEKGKAVALPLTYSSLQKTKDSKNSDAMPFASPLQKTKDKRKAVTAPINCSLVDKSRDRGKAIAVSFSNLGKTKDNGKVVSVPIAFPSLESTREKKKAFDVPFSCPPPLRTKKIRTEFNGDGDVGLSKSCTVPLPKNKKKRHCLLDVLPQEFIELQRAYFKDVDEFELAEEEVSESELDNEEEKCCNHDEVRAP